MELNIEIKPDFNGSIQIIDISDNEYQQIYLDEDSELNYGSDGSFKFSDTYTLDILRRITVNNNRDIVSYVYTKHEDSNIQGTSYTHDFSDLNGESINQFINIRNDEDEITGEESINESISLSHYHFSDSVRFMLPEDGYYSVEHIVLPTIDWLNRIKTNFTLSSLQSVFNKGLYVTDGIQVYNVILSESLSITPVDLDLITEVNPIGTSISIASYKVFSIDNLKKCYTNIATKILCSGVRCGTIDSTLRFNRDFIWMTINVINFYLESDLYTEAEIVLEDLGCYNFCDMENDTTPNRRPCGCRH